MGFTSVEEIETRAKAEDCQLWDLQYKLKM